MLCSNAYSVLRGQRIQQYGILESSIMLNYNGKLISSTEATVRKSPPSTHHNGLEEEVGSLQGRDEGLLVPLNETHFLPLT